MGLKTKNSRISFFKVPHFFPEDERFNKLLTQGEKNFFYILCKLHNRLADENGWFWHTDKLFETREGIRMGFSRFGISSSVCKTARVKLRKLKLIETKRAPKLYGQHSATCYRLLFLKKDSEYQRPDYTLVRDQYNPSPEDNYNP